MLGPPGIHFSGLNFMTHELLARKPPLRECGIESVPALEFGFVTIVNEGAGSGAVAWWLEH